VAFQSALGIEASFTEKTGVDTDEGQRMLVLIKVLERLRERYVTSLLFFDSQFS